MSSSHKVEPLFYEKDQAILKYRCNENLFNVSSLHTFYHPVDSADSTGFAIKYVTEGTERYTVNNQLYHVNNGSYLLLNGAKEAKVEIESKSNVKGLCITISNVIIADTVAAIVRPDTPFSDPELASFFYTDRFLENQYQSTHTALGNRLRKISNEVQRSVFSANDIDNELFFELAERLITDQILVFKQLQSIQAIKQATQRDLCRRVIRGREFIDSNYTRAITIEQVAKEAAMSEYHFFRLFKKVFQMSPHQYIMSRRLDAAKMLLKEQLAVSDVAIECGFGDIYTFSKAFKKHVNIAPSAFAAKK